MKEGITIIIVLDLQSETPIYTQLVNRIIEGIASGSLKPGEPLPSVRSLAADIGVNMHTVNKAYSILKQEGFIQIHRQKGVVVQPDGMPGVTGEYLDKLKEALRPLAAEAACRGMNKQELQNIVEAIYTQLKVQKGDAGS